MNKQEAIEVATRWWGVLVHEDRMDYKRFYKHTDYYTIYLSEHPEIQITETPTLFEKCENLWQNLNAVVLLEGKVDYEFLKQVLITNKPSKDDK